MIFIILTNLIALSLYSVRMCAQQQIFDESKWKNAFVTLLIDVSSIRHISDNRMMFRCLFESNFKI